MTIEEIICKCPHCGELVETYRVMSQNTFGAEFWSDGKANGLMMEDTSSIKRCPHCKEKVWAGEFKEVAKEDIPEDHPLNPYFYKIFVERYGEDLEGLFGGIRDLVPMCHLIEQELRLVEQMLKKQGRWERDFENPIWLNNIRIALYRYIKSLYQMSDPKSDPKVADTLIKSIFEYH